MGKIEFGSQYKSYDIGLFIKNGTSEFVLMEDLGKEGPFWTDSSVTFSLSSDSLAWLGSTGNMATTGTIIDNELNNPVRQPYLSGSKIAIVNKKMVRFNSATNAAPGLLEQSSQARDYSLVSLANSYHGGVLVTNDLFQSTCATRENVNLFYLLSSKQKARFFVNSVTLKNDLLKGFGNPQRIKDYEKIRNICK